MLAPIKKPLTNQDVIQMVRTKFADSTILKTIQASETNFDISVTALVALKTAGASQQVIEEMLSVGTSKKEVRLKAIPTPPSVPPPTNSLPAKLSQSIDPNNNSVATLAPVKPTAARLISPAPTSVPATGREGVPVQPVSQASLGPCVILKRMGPADQITSHMYSFGIRGKQFQYVEGEMPAGVKFHGRLTDHDIRNIQDHGGRLVIMEPKYSADDLREAKQSCKNK